MHAGAITSYIDVAQVAFWTFFLGFLALVFYLRREDKREGYPLKDPGRPDRQGFPVAPERRVYHRLDGTTTIVPHDIPDPPMSVRPARMPDDPMIPVGNPLTAALGPGTYTMRADTPFLTIDQKPQVQPLRVATNWSVMPGESDPRGMQVLDVRFRPMGTVRELWVDRGVRILRYLEIELYAAYGEGPVLVPIYFCDINEDDREVRVTALRRDQFATAPRLRSPDQITAREEDQVNAYYAGGRFHLNDSVEGTTP